MYRNLLLIAVLMLILNPFCGYAQNPESKLPYWKRQVAYERYRDIESANKVFSDSIRESPNPAPFYLLKAIGDYYLEDYDKAKDAIARAGLITDFQTNLSDYHDGLTCILMKYLKEVVGKEVEADAKELSSEVYKPVNLSLMIDVSGSMYSERRLHRLKSTVKKLVDILRPDDKLSVTVFNHEIVYQVSNIKYEERKSLKTTINNLSPRGGTVFEGAISNAYQQVFEAYLSDGKNQIIVATDGAYLEGKVVLNQLKRKIKSHADSVSFSVVGISQTDQASSIMSEWSEIGKGVYRPVTEWEPNTDAIINVLKIISVDEAVANTIVDGIRYPELHNEKDSVLYKKAEDNLARQSYSKALSILEKLKKTYTNSPLIFKRCAEIHQYYKADYLSAIEEWEKLLTINPKNSFASVNKAYCYARMGNFHHAIKSYEVSIAHGNETKGHNNLGCANWLHQDVAPPHRRDIEDAKKNFTDASQNTDADAYIEIVYNKGLVMLKQNIGDDAILAFTNIIEKDSSDADAYFLRGLGFMNTEQYTEAHQDINLAIELQYVSYGDKLN
ncbi:VWA domain-containing protein [Flavobacteriales bacterium]|nr:VWA domain-containing protein [Flavobacteriales bacterium]